MPKIGHHSFWGHFGTSWFYKCCGGTFFETTFLATFEMCFSGHVMLALQVSYGMVAFKSETANETLNPKFRGVALAWRKAGVVTPGMCVCVKESLLLRISVDSLRACSALSRLSFKQARESNPQRLSFGMTFQVWKIGAVGLHEKSEQGGERMSEDRLKGVTQQTCKTKIFAEIS